MSDLTDFLLARIAEDEAVAREAGGDDWTYEPYDRYADGCVVRTAAESGTDEKFVAMTSYDGLSYTQHLSDEDGAHIATHDPARVLAECEAKRRIVEEWAACANDRDAHGRPAHLTDPAASMLLKSHAGWLRILAAIYADHPEYRDGWRP